MKKDSFCMEGSRVFSYDLDQLNYSTCFGFDYELFWLNVTKKFYSRMLNIQCDCLMDFWFYETYQTHGNGD